jgi:hypothetical protein
MISQMKLAMNYLRLSACIAWETYMLTLLLLDLKKSLTRTENNAACQSCFEKKIEKTAFILMSNSRKMY